ncbi:MAG: hypothetical protein JW797_05740 [Bradymonadales bacterium]|nr:hypothetical protein [Bradymonadales bacterium]
MSFGAIFTGMKVTFGTPTDHGDTWHGKVLAAASEQEWWVASYAILRKVAQGRTVETLTMPGDVLGLRVRGDRIDAAPYRIRGGEVVDQPPLVNKTAMGVVPEHTRIHLADWSGDGSVLALLGHQRPGRGPYRGIHPPGEPWRLWLMDGILREHPREIWAGGEDKYSVLTFASHWLVLAGTRLRVFDEKGALQQEQTPPADIAGGCFTSDEGHFVAALENGEIGVYQTSDWSLRHRIGRHETPWLSAAPHPHPPLVLVGADDGTVAAVDSSRGKVLRTTHLASPMAIHAMAVSSAGDTVLLSTSGRMWTIPLSVRLK